MSFKIFMSFRIFVEASRKRSTASASPSDVPPPSWTSVQDLQACIPLLSPDGFLQIPVSTIVPHSAKAACKAVSTTPAPRLLTNTVCAATLVRPVALGPGALELAVPESVSGVASTCSRVLKATALFTHTPHTNTHTTPSRKPQHKTYNARIEGYLTVGLSNKAKEVCRLPLP